MTDFTERISAISRPIAAGFDATGDYCPSSEHFLQLAA